MINGYKCFGTIIIRPLRYIVLNGKMFNNTNLFVIGELFNECYKVLTKA